MIKNIEVYSILVLVVVFYGFIFSIMKQNKRAEKEAKKEEEEKSKKKNS